jgi:hypothetical protein
MVVKKLRPNINVFAAHRTMQGIATRQARGPPRTWWERKFSPGT